jgi:hypothetical protein
MIKENKMEELVYSLFYSCSNQVYEISEGESWIENIEKYLLSMFFPTHLLIFRSLI